MPTNIIVPELGESIVEATIARWLKNEGDSVQVGEPLVELETDKIDLEVGATQNGVLARIARRDGEDVRIGELLGVIEESAGAESVIEEPPDVGADLALQVRPAEKDVTAPGRQVESAQPPTSERTRATASARRLAEENDINLTAVRGSGESGRVTRKDVEGHLRRAGGTDSAEGTGGAGQAGGAGESRRAGETSAHNTASARPTLVPPPSAHAPRAEEERPEERVRMSRRRQTIARRLVEAQHNAAMLTTFNEIDMTGVQELRRRRKEQFKQRYGVNLGLTSFFVKAAVAALRAFPRLNAEIQGDEMLLKHYYDIGIAVGASEGLVVPVLRDADRMSFASIESAIKEFARKAEDGGLTLEDLRGGSFTITNGGVFGSLLSTPILNPPQVGILGLHKIEDRPIADGGQVVVRPMMYLALSYDHRIVDGLEAVQFLVKIKEMIEDPANLLLEG